MSRAVRRAGQISAYQKALRAKEHTMYIGGGLVALIVIVLLLMYVF